MNAVIRTGLNREQAPFEDCAGDIHLLFDTMIDGGNQHYAIEHCHAEQWQ